MEDQRVILAFIVILAFSILAFGQAKTLKPRLEKARDPVCGIMVEKDPKLAVEYQGKVYYFCSNADRIVQKEPAKVREGG